MTKKELITKLFEIEWKKRSKMHFNWEWVEDAGCINKTECRRMIKSIFKQLSEQPEPDYKHLVCLSPGSCIHEEDGIGCKDCNYYELNKNTDS